jgi:HEAT repeat protein
MVLKWRLGSDEPALRTAAVKDAGSWSAEDAALLDQLVESLKTDESRPVRNAAARSLGQLGSRRPLPAEATRALSALVLHEQDDSLLSAAIAAVGQSAARNRYPYAVIKRIAGISAEEHFAWVYSQSATALGQIGAAQPLSGPVFAMMNVRFLHPRRDGEREHIADAFAEIARSQYLPLTTLDMLAAAFARESNRHVRKSILYALAHSATYYPYSVTLITAATRDPDQDIVARAKHGLRIIKSNRSSASKGPLSVAMNSSLPVDTRLKALQIIRGARIDAAAHEQIVALAGDPETKIAAAAVEMFHWLTRSADDDFDQRVLIPALSRAMSDSESVVRYAAYGELSTMSRNEPAYLRAGDLPAQLEIAANDPDPRVRVVVLAMMLRDEAQRDAVIERGMDDPDPYVRSNAARWLTYPRVRTGPRQTFIAEVLADLNQDVRRSAAAAQEALKMRERDWPIALWQLWRTVERNKVGLRTLIAVTVATPILIGGMFLLYYMARLLSYLRQRRWRAAAAVPVMATWAAASSGMFLLYFAVGHAGDLDPSGIIILTSALWVGIACYATLGWGMHFAVRR